MKLSKLIVPKVFDTKLFGYRVGSIDYALVGNRALKEILDIVNQCDYQLIYFYGENIHEKERAEIRTVANFYERKVILSKKIQLLPSNYAGLNVISSLNKDLDEGLLNLVYQSGKYSRFNLDKNFRSKDFKSLYKIWIQKSLSGDLADEIFVSENENREIVGFVTIKLEEEFSEIGLIAVDEKVRGRNIGSNLLKAVEIFSKNSGISQINVATQEVNEKAIEFYLKNGYHVMRQIDIFHIKPNRRGT